VRRLNGASIALLEARMSCELEGLVRRYGGHPRSAPALRELPLESPVGLDAFFDHLSAGRFRLAIFLTGVGVTTLFREASARGRLDEIVGALRRTTIACRGSKPAAALRPHGVPTHLSAREPFTSAELLEALQSVELANLEVALVHYGERNEPLAAALRSRGARVEELCLYEWQLPENVDPLRELIADVIQARVDVVAFTSKVQCRHLFQPHDLEADGHRARRACDAGRVRRQRLARVEGRAVLRRGHSADGRRSESWRVARVRTRLRRRPSSWQDRQSSVRDSIR